MTALVCVPACFAPAGGEPCARCAGRARPIDALPRGAIVGGTYRIGRILGRGGYAITYLALDTRLGMPVAIKEFMPQGLGVRVDGGAVAARDTRQSGAFDASIASFAAEAQPLARLRHPGIVQVLRLEQERGTGYLVMPYLEGESLRERHEALVAAGRTWDTAALVALMAPVADALAYVHGLSPMLLHRDIKPDNIFLVAERGGDVPILLDFGAARHVLATQQRGRSDSLVHTPGYTPIEQVIDDQGRQGPGTDVYALAATLYVLLTGTAPAESLLRLGLRTMGDDPYVPVAVHRPDLPAAFGAALDRGLAFSVADRPTSAPAFVAALRAALA